MWYSKVVADLGNIPDFITHYEQELGDAKRDCRVGGLIEKNITALPGCQLPLLLNPLPIQPGTRKRRTSGISDFA